MNKLLCLCIFSLLFISATPALALCPVKERRLCFEGAVKRSSDRGERSPTLQIACLKKCHESYCARAQRAFAESERLVFKDSLQSRWEYEQGCFYLQRARIVLYQMECLRKEPTFR